MILILKVILSAGLGASVFTGAWSPGDKLSVGDPAPALSIEHFAKGERVDVFPTDKVTVVEFWATWCKPCIKGFPHLSELQERYAEDLVIVGVSSEGLDIVEPFLAKPKHAKATRYRVGSDPDGSMQRDWMTAAKQMGIPCAFIVDRAGIVRYIGHPMTMDRVLAQVITDDETEATEAMPPVVSDAEHVALTTVAETHSAEAAAWIDTLQAELVAPDGVLDFEQELLLRDAIRTEGTDIDVHDLRKTRRGVLTLGPSRVSGTLARIEATRTMHLPDMPGEGLTESETVIISGDSILVKHTSDSPFMPSPLATDGWTEITRADARALADAVPIPMPIAALMELNPVVASPLDLLDALLDMSALEVEQAPGEKGDEDVVVLSGPAAPLAGIPALLESRRTLTDDDLDLPVLRLEFIPGSGDLSLQVGAPGSPSLSMKIHRRARSHEAAPELFVIPEGDAPPEALLPMLRERTQQQMRGTQQPDSR